MEIDECGIATRAMVEAIARVYRDQLNKGRHPNIDAILVDAGEWMEEEKLAELRRHLIAAWLGWRAEQYARRCGSI